MGVVPFFAQGGALVHAEAVLLVGDDKAQPGILHVLRQQGVGADAKVDLPQGQPLQYGPALLCLGGSGEQGYVEAEGGEKGR